MIDSRKVYRPYLTATRRRNVGMVVGERGTKGRSQVSEALWEGVVNIQLEGLDCK